MVPRRYAVRNLLVAGVGLAALTQAPLAFAAKSGQPGAKPKPAHTTKSKSKTFDQKHHHVCSAAAIAGTVEALIAARAPLDLVAIASRYVFDELTHVELAARVLSELGGAVPLMHDPLALYPPPEPGLAPLLRAADLVIRVFCIGEAFSVPMAQLAAKKADHPLIAAVLRRIAKDEAAHGSFGWTFFDWAGEQLDDRDRAHLNRLVKAALAAYEQLVADLPPSVGTLGWLSPEDFRVNALRTLEEDVKQPLRARRLYTP